MAEKESKKAALPADVVSLQALAKKLITKQTRLDKHVRTSNKAKPARNFRYLEKQIGYDFEFFLKTHKETTKKTEKRHAEAPDSSTQHELSVLRDLIDHVTQAVRPNSESPATSDNRESLERESTFDGFSSPDRAQGSDDNGGEDVIADKTHAVENLQTAPDVDGKKRRRRASGDASASASPSGKKAKKMSSVAMSDDPLMATRALIKPASEVYSYWTSQPPPKGGFADDLALVSKKFLELIKMKKQEPKDQDKGHLEHEDMNATSRRNSSSSESQAPSAKDGTGNIGLVAGHRDEAGNAPAVSVNTAGEALADDWETEYQADAEDDYGDIDDNGKTFRNSYHSRRVREMQKDLNYDDHVHEVPEHVLTRRQRKDKKTKKKDHRMFMSGALGTLPDGKKEKRGMKHDEEEKDEVEDEVEQDEAEHDEAEQDDDELRDSELEDVERWEKELAEEISPGPNTPTPPGPLFEAIQACKLPRLGDPESARATQNDLTPRMKMVAKRQSGSEAPRRSIRNSGDGRRDDASSENFRASLSRQLLATSPAQATGHEPSSPTEHTKRAKSIKAQGLSRQEKRKAKKARKIVLQNLKKSKLKSTPSSRTSPPLMSGAADGGGGLGLSADRPRATPTSSSTRDKLVVPMGADAAATSAGPGTPAVCSSSAPAASPVACIGDDDQRTRRLADLHKRDKKLPSAEKEIWTKSQRLDKKD